MECIPHYASRQNSTSTFTGGKCEEQVGSRVSSLERERFATRDAPTFVPKSGRCCLKYQDKLILNAGYRC